MSVYTKNGDGGKTSLLSEGKYSKSSEIFDVLGSIDELSASLGLLYKSRIKEVVEFIEPVQNDLFLLGSLIADKKTSQKNYDEFDDKVMGLEDKIDEYDECLPPLKNFILPSGAENAVRLHQSRVICRRLERELVKYYAKQIDVKGKDQILKYVNRLSDALFVFARYVNFKLGVKDQIWKG